jgi:type VI secretion system secreted protein VgrG
LAEHAGAAGCSAVGGEALLYTGPVAAGALAFACGNAMSQGLKILSNSNYKWSWKSFVFDTGLGAGLGAFGGVTVNGWTAEEKVSIRSSTKWLQNSRTAQFPTLRLEQR